MEPSAVARSRKRRFPWDMQFYWMNHLYILGLAFREERNIS